MRTRRSDPASPGYTRRRHGRSFRYCDPGGTPLAAAEVERIRALAIPPAWVDVWICPDPAGHIQAVGTDAAGRRQYRYHDAWRANRDRRKFDHVLDVAEHLPRLRRRVRAHLRGSELSRERVLAAAVSVLDEGRLRVGGDEYAVGEDATFGVASMLARHVRVGEREAVFRFPAKGGIEQEVTLDRNTVVETLRQLRRWRRGERRLFAWREGGRAREAHSADINAYLRELTGREVTAKDFRTWHATVAAAMSLAAAERGSSAAARRRIVAATMREVAEDLGNTPTVARNSYVDPRVVDLFHAGVTIPAGLSAQASEAAVLDLLRDNHSPGA
jgi:DNA topoisomerase IB